MRKPGVVPLLKAIGLTYTDGVQLFKILDCDDSGEIDPGELISGCVRLQGYVKAIDFAAFLHDFWDFTELWYKHTGTMNEMAKSFHQIKDSIAAAAGRAP